MSVCASARPPVRIEQLGSRWTDIHKSLHLRIFRKSVENIHVSLKPDKNNGTLHEDQHTFLITSRSILLRMRNVSDESCRENQTTHFTLKKTFF
jgi:hypothetical protein